RKQLERGRMVTELMKQPQYSPMSVSEMSITLYAADKGYYDDIEVKRALEFERTLLSYLKQNAADLMNKMETTKDLDGESEKQLVAAITAFKGTWV
ncbi:MAG: F0F1 ATP synthase subunit alpha, partial [Azovibrio sp.]